MTTNITLSMNYVAGHLRYGHFELDLDDEQLEEFNKASKEEKLEWITEEGEMIIDDYEVDDWGHSGEIYINGKKLKGE